MNQPLGAAIKCEREIPGVVDAVFAAHEIVGRQWPIDPRQRVIVNGVDLAKIGAHLADFH